MNGINSADWRPTYEAKSANQRMSTLPTVLSTYPIDNLISTVGEFLGIPEPQQLLEHPSITPGRISDSVQSLFPAKEVLLDNENGRFGNHEEVTRREFLTAYVKWIHPIFPVLNLPEFLDGVVRNMEDNPSPLLYQAVFFAGSAFVGLDTVHLAGYNSHREMRMTFLDRAKWLYELESDPDLVSQIQALLLMAFSHGMEEPGYGGPSHWLSQALSKMQMGGLGQPSNQYPTNTLSTRFLRRLRSCLYLCDKLVQLSLGQPAHITESILPIILPEDFDIEEYPLHLQSALSESAVQFLEPEFQMRAHLLYVKKVELSVHIGTLLGEAYASSSLAAGPFHSPPMSLIPTRVLPTPGIKQCYSDLTMWLNGFSGGLHRLPQDCESVESVFMVHQANLNLLYMAALIALCLCLRGAADVAPITETLVLEVMKTVSHLHCVRLHTYQSPTVITVLHFVVAVCSLDRASHGPYCLNPSSISMLQKIAEVADELQNVHPAAAGLITSSLAAIQGYSEGVIGTFG